MYMCVCMYVFMYVYMYIYTHIKASLSTQTVKISSLLCRRPELDLWVGKIPGESMANHLSILA